MASRRLIWGSCLVVAAVVSYWYLARDDERIPVSVNGVNHMGYRFRINRFYIDGNDMSNIGREGGGGTSICCMLLPSVWKAGLTADIRWEEYDYELRKVRRFKATTPVEKYDEPGEIVVHIFRDRTVRIVSSNWDVMHHNHPVAWGESDGGPHASKGLEIPETFTKEELKIAEEHLGELGSGR